MKQEKEREQEQEISSVPPQEDPEVIAARVKRRLMMGAALFLAFASIYGGMLGMPWGIQVALAVSAALCLIRGLRVHSETS